MAVILDKLDNNGQTLVIELMGYIAKYLKYKLLSKNKHEEAYSALSLYICELVLKDFDKWNKMPTALKKSKCKFYVLNAINNNKLETANDLLHPKHAQRKVLTPEKRVRSRQVDDDYELIHNRFPSPYKIAELTDEYEKMQNMRGINN